MTSVSHDMDTVIPADVLTLLKQVGRIAADKGNNSYLVGGTVRDLLLGRSNLDLDIVVEGDAPSLARQLEKVLGWKVEKTHLRFMTATSSWGTITIDSATARSEEYAYPGALPTVKPGRIEEDLRRRDLTINAMAVRLDPDNFGDLVDPHGGRDDLNRGLIRVMHKDSFTDDPTRIWRAIRYEQRLGFMLEIYTEELLRNAVETMENLSGDRLRHELERIMEEKRPENALCRADDLGALQQLVPSLKGDGWLAKGFEELRLTGFDPESEKVLYLALLAWRLDQQQLDSLVDRLKFGSEVKRVLLDIPGLKKALPAIESQELLPSGLYHLLERYQQNAIEAAAIAVESTVVHERLRLYLDKLMEVSPSLGGIDLKQMGVPAGKKLGIFLRSLKDAKLDGQVKTREEEQDLVRQWLKRKKR